MTIEAPPAGRRGSIYVEDGVDDPLDLPVPVVFVALPVPLPLLLPVPELEPAEDEPPDDLAVPDEDPEEASVVTAAEEAAADEALVVAAADVMMSDGLGAAALVLPRVSAGAIAVVSIPCSFARYVYFDSHLSSLDAPAAALSHLRHCPAMTRP